MWRNKSLHKHAKDNKICRAWIISYTHLNPDVYYSVYSWSNLLITSIYTLCQGKLCQCCLLQIKVKVKVNRVSPTEPNGDDVEYAMIVVDENNSTINELDSPSMKVRSSNIYIIVSVIILSWHDDVANHECAAFMLCSPSMFETWLRLCVCLLVNITRVNVHKHNANCYEGLTNKNHVSSWGATVVPYYRWT